MRLYAVGRNAGSNPVRSKIRRLGFRHRIALGVEMIAVVLRADEFLDRTFSVAVAHHCPPRHCKGARVFDRERHFDAFARAAATTTAPRPNLRDFPALGYVKLLGMRRA